jgi:alpha-N-arabinofuranosidase
MRGGAMDRGTYAPTIRYHNGTFYMVNTLVGSALGNYYVTATDPKGPWSEPIKLQGIGGIDPDFFFDDDGKCYVTSSDDPPQSQYNGHRAIKLQELDLEQKKPVGEKTIIIDGGTDITQHPVWCEGPHIYKINGKYYAMCAQGGTSTAHTEVIFKSDSLRGPYAPWDQNPILTQMNLPNNRENPVTCTGHADMVQTQNGEWYAVFLGCQPYQGNFFNTGRETFMLPVTWTADGWPVIVLRGTPVTNYNNPQIAGGSRGFNGFNAGFNSEQVNLPLGTPVPLTVKKPNLPSDKPAAVATTGNISFTENFDSDTLAPRWVGIRVPTSQWWVTSKANKALLLEPRADQLSVQGNPSYLGVRQQNNDFNCAVTLTAQPNTTNCVAGLAAFQNEGHYYAINVKIDSGHLTEISLEKPAGGLGGRRAAPPRRGGSPTVVATQKLPDNLAPVELKIEGAGPVTKCFYKVGNGEFTQLGEDLQSSFLSTDTAGGFQGVTLGVFAHN